MITGLKSLYAVAAVSGEAEERSSALPYALSLAAAAGAHVSAHCAAIRLVLPSASSSHTVAGLVATENQRLAELARARAAAVRADAEAAGVACSAVGAQSTYSELTAAVARQSRVHDLTLVDACASALDAPRGLAEAALFEGGRPVLIVPSHCETFQLTRAIISWDGSVMAARAVAAALPLLRAAQEVEILSISGEKDISREVPGADLAAHLAHHGVRSNCKDLAAGSRGVGDLLREQAEMLHADLIVMGAYKHSRLRQWVLGGVTQTMLEESPAPVLMSH